LPSYRRVGAAGLDHVHEKAGEQGAAERQAVDDDVLVDRGGARADGPQGAGVSMPMCPSTGWAPGPMAPRRSSTGTPSAAAKLPSETPPVAPSASSTSSSAASARACS